MACLFLQVFIVLLLNQMLCRLVSIEEFTIGVFSSCLGASKDTTLPVRHVVDTSAGQVCKHFESIDFLSQCLHETWNQTAGIFI